ncbi:hypothetical protein FRC19_001453, partial [Serendipita sp. 401]
MEDEPLLLPLVVPQGSRIIEESCVESEPTILATWRPANKFDALYSVALGSEDGSTFIFQPKPQHISISETSHIDNNASLRPARPTSPRPSSSGHAAVHGPPSPSISNAGSSYLKSPIGSKGGSFQPSKSRVQAALSKEQAEAPKNYVDYDDEPKKLKSLLKAKEQSKDRGLLDNFLPSLRTGHRRQSTSDSAPSHLGKEPSFSQMSTNNPSSSSTSPPTSPVKESGVTTSVLPIGEISLVAHAIPPRFGVGRATTALHFVEDGTILISLQECGTLCMYSSADGYCLCSIEVASTTIAQPPAAMPSMEENLKGVWKWQKFEIGISGETTFLLLAASDITTTWEKTPAKTRVVVVKFKVANERTFSTPSEYLSKIGEWVVESALDNLGMTVDTTGSPVFYHLSSSKELLFHKLQVLDRVKITVPSEDSAKQTTGLTNLEIPNPFKIRRPRAVRPVSVYDVRKNEDGLVDLEKLDVSITPPLGEHDEPTAVTCIMDGKLAIISTPNIVKIYAKRENELVLLQEVPVLNCHHVYFSQPDTLVIIGEVEDHLYSLKLDEGGELKFRLIKVTPKEATKGTYTVNGQYIISTYLTSRRFRKLQASPIGLPESKRRTLWKATSRAIRPSVAAITSILPVDLSMFILGYDDGFIRRTSLTELFSPKDSQGTIGEPSDHPLDGSIVHLSLIRNERSGEYCIIGGTDAGGVAVWALQSLKLLARWVLFATPLISVTRLIDDAVGKLKGSALCVASGGTLAILLLDSLDIAFVVPGGPGRLEKICLGEDNLLLVYANDLARLWDVKTQEFWRSMTREKAEELLEQGGWLECLIEPGGPTFSSALLGRAGPTFSSYDNASSLVLNMRYLLSGSEGSSPPTPGMPTSDMMPKVKPLDVFRNLVASCHTFDMEESIDLIIRDTFEILPNPTYSGVCGYGGATSLVNVSSNSVWTVSPRYTALRLLFISSILRSSMTADDLEQRVNDILLYYTASLPDTIGKRFCRPLFETFAKYWFDPITEIRTSARSLFEAAIGQLSDADVVNVVEEYRHRLPCLQPDINKEADWAVTALIITGNLAVARHAVISPSTITDIVTSIVTFLHDHSSAHRVIGIDLSSRGLQIWQTYTDTMEILRSLFELATSSRKDPEKSSIRDPGTQARLAVLHVASSSTPLFMTKLLLDLTHPRSPEHSRSVMQLLAFLIRKRPLILYPSLSRIMEAVVRSMDPNSAFRETVLNAATEIIGEVVRLYPTVDFHATSQKLVVGTHEGAAILYDMKTSTRLYVLEGHKKRLAACSFSPDGRRLVTLSLEESIVMVWKVGTSFSSFFFPGAPPSQGHSGSQPFKTLNFNVGSE